MPQISPPMARAEELKRHEYNRHRSLSTSYSSAFSDSSHSASSISASAELLPPPSTDLLLSLVTDLDSDEPHLQLAAAAELRLLAKNSSENRLRIAKAGAALPLISLLSSSDALLQEHSTTALLNLSLLDLNRPLLAAAGAIPALNYPLRSGTPSARANAAAALLRLSQHDNLRHTVARSGAIPLLVDLLRSPHPRGQKDAATALYALCSGDPETKVRAARAGIVRPLLDLLAAGEPGIADKAAYLLATVSTAREIREGLVAEGGVAVLVEIIEERSSRQREAAADVLHRMCEDNDTCRALAVREGAVSALSVVARSGTDHGRKKAEALLELLVPRRERVGVTVDVPAEQCY